MLFIKRSGNSVIPVRHDFLFPLKFADVSSRSLASIGVGYGCKVVVVEQAHIAVDEMEYSFEASILCYLIIQPRRCREVTIIIVDTPKASTAEMAYA